MVQFIFIAILGVMIISILYVLFILQIPNIFGGFDFSQSGTFGDSWGALTSFFSALGFCGVLWTLKTQNESIRRVEIESSRKEKNEAKRDFENSFFNMLNLLQVIINDMRVVNKMSKDVLAEGRGVFLYFYKPFRSKMLREGEYRVSQISNQNELEISAKNIGLQYSHHFNNRSQNLSHYYRFLFNFYKFIDESDIENEDKKKYANILRAQISNYELLMLFYNSLSENGEKFKSYFEKYEVLDNLPVLKLTYRNHVLLVNEKCWGDNKGALAIINSGKIRLMP
ncbi:putative phage abortive infection protein [Type-E symbiont of Plautia stali]|uniref:putative phage abortive infection protein n=1 Tax=Type-E symbiont of Plautia stali TaxID=1560357 RepID=UPI00073E6EDE|nr:putative phage abortive infection protein [Type-E symbiont of Plautia stali]